MSCPALLAAIGMQELLVILAILLLLFGATQIPRLMRSMGQGVHEFRKGLEEGAKDPPGQADRAAGGDPPRKNGS